MQNFYTCIKDARYVIIVESYFSNSARCCYDTATALIRDFQDVYLRKQGSSYFSTPRLLKLTYHYIPSIRHYNIKFQSVKLRTF